MNIIGAFAEALLAFVFLQFIRKIGAKGVIVIVIILLIALVMIMASSVAILSR